MQKIDTVPYRFIRIRDDQLKEISRMGKVEGRSTTKQLGIILTKVIEQYNQQSN